MGFNSAAGVAETIFHPNISRFHVSTHVFTGNHWDHHFRRLEVEILMDAAIYNEVRRQGVLVGSTESQRKQPLEIGGTVPKSKP